jgi:hypothetical protein
MCYSLFKSDEFYIGSKHPVSSIPEKAKTDEVTDKDKETPAEEVGSEKKLTASIAQLEGILSYIYHVKKAHDKRDIKDKRCHPTALIKLYRNFLFYRYFFSLDRPLIICEGKTDPIYLKCALKQLFEDYDVLVEKTKDRFHFHIAFLKRSKNIEAVLGISGGTGGLLLLLNIYKQYMTLFKGNGKKYPVIILVDDDGGSKEIKKILKEKDFTKPFYYFDENLYVVPISLGVDGKETMIEDLFDDEILAYKIEGKTFNYKQKIDTKTEYGKTVFAEKVVKAHQNKINFNGFKDVLNRFKEVIEDYKTH